MTIVTNVIGLLITLDIIIVALGIIAGIVLAIVAYSTQDVAAKKNAKTWMWRAFLGPIGVLILLIIVNGFLDLFANTFK